MPKHKDQILVHSSKITSGPGNPNNIGLPTGGGFQPILYTGQLYCDTTNGVLWVADSDLGYWVVMTTPYVLDNLHATPTSRVAGSTRDILYSGVSACYVIDNGSTVSWDPGEDTDSSKLLTSHEIEFSPDSGGFSLIFYTAVPKDFSGWDTNGIRFQHKFTQIKTDEQPTIVVELYDPATGAPFGSPLLGTRTPTVADTVYAWTGVDGATIASSYKAGDMLEIHVDVTSLVGSGGSSPNHICRVSTLELNWN